ncbi:MAG: winged helix-turn-helix domain-containing protein [Candidatus Kapaibacterium sp.]
MLDSLITSKTRIKLLLKFFLNTDTKGYLNSLAKEFGESTNAVRLELNRLSKAGLLEADADGRTKVYRANKKNPLFPEINTLVRKYLGIDIVEEVLNKLGNVEAAYITGDYARGADSGVIDLVIVGDINRNYLFQLIDITEENIKRKIRPLILSSEEFAELKEKLKLNKALLIWQK